MVSDGGFRASDRDRERVVEVLGEQTSQGRLTLAEFEERTQRVYAARTWDELRAEVADLPVRITFAGEPAHSTDPANPPAHSEHPTDPSTWHLGRLMPVLPLLMLGGIALVLAFRLPFLVIIPLLLVIKATRHGAFRSRRSSRGFGPRYR